MTISKRPNLKPSYDPAQPPQGVRLNVGSVAARCRVTMAQLADSAGVSKTSMVSITTENRWPVRTDPVAIRAAVARLLQEHGAQAEELRTLWHAHGPHVGHEHVSTGPRGTDACGRPLGQPNPAAAAASEQEEDDAMLMKQTLSSQAARHFKCFRNPFDGEVTRDEQFFCGDDIRYVREAAWSCAQNGGFTAIVGESGAGKTTILADLESRLERDPQGGVLIIRPGVLGLEETDAKGHKVKAADILHAIITTLSPGTVVPQTMQARTVRAHKMLAESAKAGNQHLLVIEEAHSLPDATLKHLKRLQELREGRRNLLGILLVAQPELKARLAAGLRTGTLREVAQRCEIVELLPLDANLKDYLRTRAQAAGTELGKLLDDQAVEALRTRLTRRTANGATSMCYPLAVHNMVTRAMNTAAELGVPVVTADVVKAL